MKNHLFVLLLCLIAFSANSQEDTVSPKPTVIQKKTAQEGLSEKQAYKLLYENQKEANNSILNTIYWSLGGLGTAILAVFASNWWFNEKKVKDVAQGIEARIASAKTEAVSLVETKTNELVNSKTTEITQLQQKLQQDISAALADLTTKFSEFATKTQQEIQTENRLLRTEFEKLISTYNENLSGQIKSLEKVIDERAVNSNERIKSFEKLLNEKIETQELKINKLKETMSRDNTELENQVRAKIARVEATLWRRTGLLSNALLAHLEEAELNLKSNEFMLDLSFNSIVECLDKMTEIDTYRLEKTLDLVGKVPEDHAYIELVKKIEAQVKALPVKGKPKD